MEVVTWMFLITFEDIETNWLINPKNLSSKNTIKVILENFGI